MGNIKIGGWWNENESYVSFYIVAAMAAISGVTCLFLTNRLNDTNYLSVRITALQAEQRLNICRAMLPGTREAKGYDKDCTNYTSNN